MPLQVTGYRIFIASPGGLQDERHAFRDVIQAYNEAEAIPRRVLFLPTAWEMTLAGVGRPQSIINEEVRSSDYMVLLLWDRWGSPPDTTDSEYTSGTEEEFHVAMECLADPQFPMRQVVVLFKAIPAHQLSDPGDQLKRVLDFRRQLEIERTHLFTTFDVIDSFRDLLRRHLASWLREHDEGDTGLPPVPVSEPPSPTAEHKVVSPQRAVSNPLVAEARELAKAGRRTDAEALLARAIARGDDPTAFQAYGDFTFDEGRYAQAQALLERAIELATLLNRPRARVSALVTLGSALRRRGDIEAAELRYREALRVATEAKYPHGEARALSSIAEILRMRGSAVESEKMYRKAIAILESSGREADLGVGYDLLGRVLQDKGDLPGADELLTKSLDLARRVGPESAVARAQTNLGLLRGRLGDFKEAESLHRQALETNQKLGRTRNALSAQLNIGGSLLDQNSLTDAEEITRTALATAERIGYAEGMAKGYFNLGLIRLRLGDLESAEELNRKALAINISLGRQIGVAKAYHQLGIVLRDRGDKSHAAEFLTASYESYSKLGEPKVAEIVKRALDALKGSE